MPRKDPSLEAPAFLSHRVMGVDLALVTEPVSLPGKEASAEKAEAES